LVPEPAHASVGSWSEGKRDKGAFEVLENEWSMLGLRIHTNNERISKDVVGKVLVSWKRVTLFKQKENTCSIQR